MNDDPAGRGGQFRRGDPWRVDPCHSGIAVGGDILSETNDNGLEPHSELRMQSLFGSLRTRYLLQQLFPSGMG